MVRSGFSRRTLLCRVGAASAALAAPAFVPGPRASEPPVTLVVGYPPGGSTDLTARAIAPALARALDATVVVENAGGAGGAIGAQRVARAAPDGRTLFVGANGEMAIGRLVNPALPYDPQRDFTPLHYIGSQPMLFVASNATAVRDTESFIRSARAAPGRYSYGSSGVGSVLQLAGEMVKQAAGIFVVHIPYRGVAPLTNDLVGGQLPFGFFVLSSGLQHVRSGRVTALGITEARRAKIAPEIAALAEHPLLRTVDISAWYGVWAPAGLPAATAARLRSACASAMADAGVRERLEAAGTTLPDRAPDLASHLAAETRKYAAIVKFANIRE